jgi:transcriptional regulator with XRE-family HTH domain
MEDLNQLGERIRKQRIQLELKQRELADRAAVSLTSVGKLERGEPVTTATLSRVLVALGFSDALKTLVPPPPVSPLELQELAGKERQRVR